MRTGSICSLLDKGKPADGVGLWEGSQAGSEHRKGAGDVDGAFRSGLLRAGKIVPWKQAITA